MDLCSSGVVDSLLVSKRRKLGQNHFSKGDSDVVPSGSFLTDETCNFFPLFGLLFNRTILIQEKLSMSWHWPFLPIALAAIGLSSGLAQTTLPQVTSRGPAKVPGTPGHTTTTRGNNH